MTIFKIINIFGAIQIASAVCYFDSSTTWDENWYRQQGVIGVSKIFCNDTCLEDYTYEVFELGVPRTNFLLLSITKSNFSSITYLTNPITIMDKSSRIGFDFSGLSLNFCSIKSIVGNAFKNFDRLKEIDLGYNEIEDLNFVSHLPMSVRILNLARNNVKFVNFRLFSFNSWLDSLDLSFNKIANLAASGQLPVRRNLLLNNNNIALINSNLIPAFAYNELEVNLANNKIRLLNFTRSGIDIKLLNLSGSLTDLRAFGVQKVSFSLAVDFLILTNNNLLALNETYNFRRCKHIDFSNCSLNIIQTDAFQDSNFKTLNFSHNNLTLFEGSTFAKSQVHVLDLSHNRIENVNNLFKHSNVIYVNMSFNEIADLGFKNELHFYSLDLSFNKLKLMGNGSFINCLGLEVLNLSSNRMSQIALGAFGGLKKLTTLNLNNNSLVALNSQIFEPLVQISDVDLSNNKLTRLQDDLFSGLSLNSIVLSGNAIETIEGKAFNNLTKLNSITINHNNKNLTIENEAFFYLPEVKEIRLINSNIRAINLRIFSQVPNLQEFDVRDNKLTSIDFSNHSEYMNITQLDLSLSRHLKKKTFLKLQLLERLTIWNSKIRLVQGKAFQGLFTLNTLELKNTEIDLLENDALLGLFAVTNLDCKNILKGKRLLTSFMFRDLHSTEYLDLSEIGLERIMHSAFYGMRKLKRLLLSYNKLSAFEQSTFSGLDNLGFLDLSYNALFELKRDDFEGLTNLNGLDLSCNVIRDMELGALQRFPYLQTLSVARNNLTEIKLGAFSNLGQLATLDLQQNSISALPIECFQPLRSLVHLNLESNNLKTVGYLPLVSNLNLLTRVGIAQNKWKCDYLGNMLIAFKNFSIDYSSARLDFHNDNIDGIGCIDICKYLLCSKDIN